jgi:hypothetical protein
MVKTQSTALAQAKKNQSARGVAAIHLIKIGAAWGIFLIMTLFYAMLPIASLQLLPFLFFGCVCLLSAYYDDADLNEK